MRMVMTGFFGFGNLGDDLVAIAQVQLARSRFPDGHIVVIGGKKMDRIAAYADELVHWQDIATISTQLKAADLVLVGGGGIVSAAMLRGGLVFEQPLSQLSSLIMSMPMLCWIARVPCVAFCCGSYGYISPSGEGDFRFFGDLVDRVYARDRASADIIGQFTVPERVCLSYDAAFALASPELPARADAKHGTLFLTVRSFGDARDERVVHLISNTINDGMARIRTVKALVHDELDDQVGSAFQGDQVIIGRIAELCPDITFEYIDNSDVNEVLRGVANSDIGLNMRYHGCIIAMLANVPTLAIYSDENDPKFRALFERLDAPSLLFLLDNTTPSLLAQAIRNVHQRTSAERSHIEHFVNSARQRVQEVFEEACTIHCDRTAIPVGTASRIFNASAMLIDAQASMGESQRKLRALSDQQDYAGVIDRLSYVPQSLWSGELYYLAAFSHHCRSMLPGQAPNAAGVEIALRFYERAEEKGFTLFWVCYNRAQLLLNAGRVMEAFEEMRRAQACIPVDAPAGMADQIANILAKWETLLPPAA